MFHTSYSPVFHPAMAFVKIYSDCDKIWVKATFFDKIRFIIWVKTITLDLWKNTPKCVWKPHVILQNLLKTLIENVILQDLPQNLDENNKILFLFHKISFKAVLRTQKMLPFKIYFPNLRENNTFFHKICIDILECGNNYLRKGKDRNPWVFANYLEDFCHRLKLKTSLKRGWILICLGSKCIKNGNVKGWFSNDSWKYWSHDCFGLVFSLALRNGG